MEAVNPLKISEEPARTRDTIAAGKDRYAYNLLCGRSISVNCPGDSKECTSYRALRTEMGLSKNPTPTLVVAPEIKLPVVESRGNLDECSEGDAARTAVKYGEFAIARRTR